MVGGMGQLRTITAALLGFFLVPAALADDAGTPHQLGGAMGWDAWGFTDKTGSADINEKLSQERADAAARYVRIVGHGNSVDARIAITEVKIY